ncbi:MAG: hypothetical protein JO062_17355 [Bryobacterales bacterium]|nr:hypothetical protein [Bryobacterales bacterium]
MFRRILLVAVFASAALAQSVNALFNQVNPILEDLSKITGWKVEHTVPAQILPKTSFRKYMEDRLKDSNPREIHAEELTLKMFGLVPRDFNLAGETVDLMSEQAAAFYDYQKKRLFVLDSTPDGDEQRMALVHELAHALADQHHPLGKYMKQGDPDDDASTARQAVMEGQANWLTWAYIAVHAGGKPEIPPRLLDEIAASAGANGPDFPVYTNAPLYIRESLVFPYNQGTRFQDAVFHQFGKEGFDEVFLHPPQSTQQIIHPDGYFARRAPSIPDPPALEPLLGKEAKQFHILTDGALGEFDFSALLRQYVGEREGREAAAHVLGGSFRLYQNKKDKHAILAYASRWDSPEAAKTYFELYRRVLKGKWQNMDISSDTGSILAGNGDNGRFEVRLIGSSVESYEGMR